MVIKKGVITTKGQLRAIARVKERQGLDQQKSKKQGPSIRKEEWNDRFFVEESGPTERRSILRTRVKRVYDNRQHTTRATSPLDMNRIEDALKKVDAEAKVQDSVVKDITEEIFQELLQDVVTEMVSCLKLDEES